MESDQEPGVIVNMAGETQEVVRFGDFPQDIRETVYKKLFCSAILTFSAQSRDTFHRVFPDFDDNDMFHFPQNLPPILTVNKLIRAEAMSVFSKSIIVGFADDTTNLQHLSVGQRKYIEMSTTAYLFEDYRGIVNITVLPKLRNLHFFSVEIMGAYRGRYPRYDDLGELIRQPGYGEEENDEDEEETEEDKARAAMTTDEMAMHQSNLVLRSTPAGAGILQMVAQGQVHFDIILHIVFSESMPLLDDIGDRSSSIIVWGHGPEYIHNWVCDSGRDSHGAMDPWEDIQEMYIDYLKGTAKWVGTWRHELSEAAAAIDELWLKRAAVKYQFDETLGPNGAGDLRVEHFPVW